VTSQGRSESAAAEIVLADEEMHAARALLQAGAPRIALARVYFAAFHLARALLFHDDLEPRSHTGLRHLFNAHWVAPGRAEPRWNALLARLQKYREEADYAVTFPVDEAWVRDELAAVTELRAFATAAIGTGRTAG
jgi:uncharacterized protein (UPF0332 family)